MLLRFLFVPFNFIFYNDFIASTIETIIMIKSMISFSSKDYILLFLVTNHWPNMAPYQYNKSISINAADSYLYLDV